MHKTTKSPQIRNPLVGLNGQLMVMAAHRYCLGRQSYIVGSCIEWLQEHWSSFTQGTKNVILRDTVEALQDGTAGAEMDVRGWKEFAQWGYDRIPWEDQMWVKSTVAHKHQPWPLCGPQCRGEGCGEEE